MSFVESTISFCSGVASLSSSVNWCHSHALTQRAKKRGFRTLSLGGDWLLSKNHPQLRQWQLHQTNLQIEDHLCLTGFKLWQPSELRMTRITFRFSSLGTENNTNICSSREELTCSSLPRRKLQLNEQTKERTNEQTRRTCSLLRFRQKRSWFTTIDCRSIREWSNSSKRVSKGGLDPSSSSPLLLPPYPPRLFEPWFWTRPLGLSTTVVLPTGTKHCFTEAQPIMALAFSSNSPGKVEWCRGEMRREGLTWPSSWVPPGLFGLVSSIQYTLLSVRSTKFDRRSGERAGTLKELSPKGHNL